MQKNSKNNTKSIEKTRFSISLSFAFLLTAIMWTVKLYETSLNIEDLYKNGIFPLSINGLKGIIFSPFIHGDFEHLFSNTFPFLILTTTLIYFYPEKGFLIYAFMFLLTGILTWLIGRQSYHIGASGIVYALASFIFFSGIISRKREYIAIALIVIFLYGSLIWGIFPGADKKMSWEGHLSGFISGTLLSLFFSQKPDSIIKQTENIDFIFFYDFKYINSTYKNKIIYIFTPEKKLNFNYIIHYETNFYTNFNNLYNFEYISTRTNF